MATFGPIASAAPNVLFDPARALGAAADLQRNQLLQEASQQRMADSAEDRRQAVFERDRNLAGQLAGSILQLPADQRPAAYAAALAEQQRMGRLPHAPPSYPGDEHMQQVYTSILTPTQMEARSDRLADRTALGARYPMPGGATSPASVPSVPGAAPAGPATAGVPADLMPHFEEASRATGIPVPLLIAQAKQESGFRPDAVGRSGEVGIMQVMPSTAQQPGFGMQGVDPASLRDPRANIMFGAQYLAARNKGVDWNDPAQRDAGLGRYNGGGDPNYAANVTRNLPSGAPAPQPTPPGGVAARTGGTDTAGPGAGPAAPDDFTPQQQRALAERARSRGTTQAQMDQLEHSFRSENAALIRHREAMAQRQAEHPPADPTAAFGGNGIDAQANNILLRVGPKIANGTASDAERQQYELAHGHITRGSVQPVPDPSDPTGQRMMLGRVPGQVPGSFPAPDFRPPAPGAEPAAAPAPAGVQPIAGTAKPVPVKEAPAKIADSMLDNVGAVRKIDDALLELEARNGGGVGWSGYVPGAIHDRTDPGGVKLRGLIADIGSLKLHDRSGASVTASESPRLMPMIPALTDDPKTIRDKLQNFRREYTTALRDQYETYGPATGHKPMAPVERLLKGAERVKVATPEEARKLPSGTPIELPDGSPGVVP
jgi:hypothetical protein